MCVAIDWLKAFAGILFLFSLGRGLGDLPMPLGSVPMHCKSLTRVIDEDCSERFKLVEESRGSRRNDRWQKPLMQARILR